MALLLELPSLWGWRPCSVGLCVRKLCSCRFLQSRLRPSVVILMEQTTLASAPWALADINHA